MAMLQQTSDLLKEKSKPQFYRQVLPSSCIAFFSPEGKSIFREALTAGNMECYFKLAAQFSTQTNLENCALTTLVMVLNALEIDPGKVWKEPWRWYNEEMLESCVPLHVMIENGINFDQFYSLSICNSLEVNGTRADDKSSIEKFRDTVLDFSGKDNVLLALTYSRRVLEQAGDGHFSPVGGYHREKDLVLVLDTARFKYPPHWIPLSLLWEAMQSADQSTGKPRGYFTLRRAELEHLLPVSSLAKSSIGDSISCVSAGHLRQPTASIN